MALDKFMALEVLRNQGQLYALILQTTISKHLSHSKWALGGEHRKQKNWLKTECVIFVFKQTQSIKE